MKQGKRLLCLVLALLLCAGCAAPEGEKMETKLTEYVIEQAEYPVYPRLKSVEDFVDGKGNWDNEAYRQAEEDYRRALENLGKGTGTATAPLLDFADETTGRVLLSSRGESVVYSPVSLYVAMAMLAELTDGPSRAEVLHALGTEDLQAVRESVHQLWADSYCDNGVTVQRMGSSVWLNEQVEFHREALQTLAEYYYASGYRVAMGSDEANRAIGQWINEQTGGLLSDAADNIQTEAMTLLQLYTTLYFKARWRDTFRPELTEKSLFHLYDADGASVECDFMRRSSQGGYRRGDGYTAAVLPFAAEGGYMTFCLPDGDTNIDELLGRESLVSELQEMTDYGAMIHWKVPKFDVGSDVGLNELLKGLGVASVFSTETADFTPLTETTAFLDTVRQVARVKIDEEGVEAAAFTEMAVCGASLPQDEIYMTLDRPFIFAIYDAGGLPLFIGTVYQP